jgi:hypothetical protein
MYKVGVFISLIAGSCALLAAFLTIQVIGFMTGGSGAHDSGEMWRYGIGCRGLLMAGGIIYLAIVGWSKQTQTIGYAIIILSFVGCLAGNLVAPCLAFTVIGGTLCVLSGSPYPDH